MSVSKVCILESFERPFKVKLDYIGKNKTKLSLP